MDLLDISKALKFLLEKLVLKKGMQRTYLKS